MIAEALAVAAQRLGTARDAVVARLGGSIGERTRAAIAELARLDAAAHKRARAEWTATARAPVPPGLRGVHASWIEHALEQLPPRARVAVAAGGGDDIDVWLARWATAELPAMPATRPGPPRGPDDAGRLEARTLLDWLAAIGHDQLAFALGDAAAQLGEPLRAAVARIRIAPRAGQLGPMRAAIARCAGHDAVTIGARTLAPHLPAEVRRQVIARLPREIGIGVAAAFAEHASTPATRRAAWHALVT